MFRLPLSSVADFGNDLRPHAAPIDPVVPRDVADNQSKERGQCIGTSTSARHKAVRDDLDNAA